MLETIPPLSTEAKDFSMVPTPPTYMILSAPSPLETFKTSRSQSVFFL